MIDVDVCYLVLLYWSAAFDSIIRDILMHKFKI